MENTEKFRMHNYSKQTETNIYAAQIIIPILVTVASQCAEALAEIKLKLVGRLGTQHHRPNSVIPRRKSVSFLKKTSHYKRVEDQNEKASE